MLTHANKDDVLCPTNSYVISHPCSKGSFNSVASVEASIQYPFSMLVATYLFDKAFKLEAHCLGDLYGRNQPLHSEKTPTIAF